MVDRTKRSSEFMSRWSKLSWLEGALRSRPVSWAMIAILALLISVTATMSLQHIPAYMQEGMIAPRDIKADRNYEIVDEEATQVFKQEALGSVLPVFDFDVLEAENIAERVRLAFANARMKLNDFSAQKSKVSSHNKKQIEAARLPEAELIFSQSAGITPDDELWETLAREGFSPAVENYVVSLVRHAMDRPIVAERGVTDVEAPKGVIIRRMIAEQAGNPPNLNEMIVKSVDDVLTLEQAKKLVTTLDLPAYGLKNKADSKELKVLASHFVETNCAPNKQETQKRRDEAVSNVKNVVIKVKAGEMIVREGARYEPWHIKVLGGIKKEKMKGMYSVELLGTFFLALVFLLLPNFLAEKFFIRARVTRSDNILMALVGLTVLVAVRILLEAGPVIQGAFFSSIPATALAYAIPIAGGAMIVRMYLSAEISTVFSVIMSVFISIMVEEDAGFGAFCIISNFAAVIAVSGADRRSSIMRAGAITGCAGLIAAFGISLVNMASSATTIFMADVVWSMIMAFIGGLGAAVFALIGTAVVDSVSDYISDIKLLELANLNHPLLRELIVMAPGTYHHSHLVGVLGESAADAIGANSLLVRVAAYYHDIGKIKKPNYFIENQKGDNKHEKITPQMSALVVAAHVKDGLDMAKRAKIPQVISSMIPEHHGTRLMQFFYNKAKEAGDIASGKLSEKDFRYEGPLPQSAEAAILMLADATEAAVRALKEKGSARIQQTVQKVINDIFAESQLNECDLTLRDLNDIGKAFVRILLGIYHQRIEYPKDEKEDATIKSEIKLIEEASEFVPKDNSGTSNDES